MRLGKRVTGLLLAACLAVGMVPTMAFAEGTNKTIMLGTSGIGNPTPPQNQNSAWTGSYVYFGSYDFDENGTKEPVKYRVLDNETTVFGGKTMLLDCDRILLPRKFDGSNSDWNNSDIKRFLNSEKDVSNNDNPAYDYSSTGFLTTSFSKTEQDAIAESTKDNKSDKDGDGWGKLSWCSLNGEKIFILDAKEATNTSYGYSNRYYDSAVNRKKTGASSSWWLRSNHKSEKKFGYVLSDGSIIDCDVVTNKDICVSPALNINLSSVLFSSEISANSGEYKLTIIDDKLQIVLSGSASKSADSTDGDTITVPYTIGGDNRNNVTQISMLITDKEYAPGNANGAQKVYYGAMENVSQTSGENENEGTAQIELTSEVSANLSNYHVYIIAEDVNGEKETDYASNPVEITFSKDEPAKTDTENSNNSSSNTDTGSTSTSTETTVEAAPITITYTVKKDDYMRKIAREHGITLEQLIALNPQVKNPNLIYAGQILVISTTGSTVSTTEITATKTYTVQRGDSLYKIARQNGMTLAELKTLNENLFAQKYIYAGQQVLLK